MNLRLLLKMPLIEIILGLMIKMCQIKTKKLCLRSVFILHKEIGTLTFCEYYLDFPTFRLLPVSFKS